MSHPVKEAANRQGVSAVPPVEPVARLCKQLFQELPLCGLGADVLERAQQLEEEQLWLAALERSAAEQQQREMVQALCKEGRYGRCIDCDASIPPARLWVCPCALRCVACQGAYEAREGAGRRGPSFPAELFSDVPIGNSE